MNSKRSPSNKFHFKVKVHYFSFIVSLYSSPSKTVIHNYFLRTNVTGLHQDLSHLRTNPYYLTFMHESLWHLMRRFNYLLFSKKSSFFVIFHYHKNPQFPFRLCTINKNSSALPNLSYSEGDVFCFDIQFWKLTLFYETKMILNSFSMMPDTREQLCKVSGVGGLIWKLLFLFLGICNELRKVFSIFSDLTTSKGYLGFRNKRESRTSPWNSSSFEFLWCENTLKLNYGKIEAIFLLS